MKAKIFISGNLKILTMLSEIPKGFGKVKESGEKSSDAELLRVGMIAELDTINLYEQLAAHARDENVKKVFLDIVKEEKTHLGEFLEMLKKFDPEQIEELENGKKEIKELIEE